MSDYDKYYSEDYDPAKEKERFERKKKITYLIRELNSNPGSMSNIKALMDYRDLRTEQAWLSNTIFELKNSHDSDGFDIDKCRNRVAALDRNRRATHNKALGNFYGLIQDMKRRGIPPVYSGELMDPSKAPDNYGDPTVRAMMTDAFLDLLYTIEDFRVNDLKQLESTLNLDIDSISSIKSALEKSSHDWNVVEPLKTDEDGTIEFR